MANVFFKRGTLASLDQQPINNGAIYVTTDERAMYVDISDSVRIRLGDFVECTNWSAVEAITSPNPHSLYYANAENILAKYDNIKHKWAQVNGNVAIENLISYINHSAITTGNNTVLETTLVDNASNEVTGQTTYSTANGTLLKINGSTTQDANNRINASLTFTPANLKESASLSTSAVTNGVQITLTNSQTGTDASGTVVNTSAADANPVKLISTGGLTIQRNSTTGNIEFSANSSSYIDLSSSFSNSGALNLVLTDGDNNQITQATQAIPTITYGQDSTLSAVFSAGTAVLDIYTADEVDALIGNELKALDAMTFKGTLGLLGTVSALPTTNVHNGDTYKVIDAATYNSQQCRIGDMFIASGTETNGVLTDPIIWTYIPSGNDGSVDFFFTYDNTSHSIRFEDNSGILTSFTPGASITFSGTNSSITIAHDTVSRTNDTATSVVQNDGSNLTFNAVTSIESNATGHITRVVTTPITVRDTHNDLVSISTSKTASTANGVQNISTSIVVTDMVGSQSTTDVIESHTLDLSVSNNKAVIDLVWGTF